MPSALIIAENTGLTTDPYPLTINPIQPRGMRANQPATVFNTLSGAGGVQAMKDWFPTIILTWPDLVRSNSDHAALVAAFEARQYVKTGLSYFIGITGDKDSGFPFPGANKYIEIRIIEVQSVEQPVDNDLDEVIFGLIVTAKWLDTS